MSTPEQVMAWGVGFLSLGSNHVPWSYMESGRPTSLMEQRAPYWQQKGHEKTSWADTQSMVDGLLSTTGKEWVSLWIASAGRALSCFHLIDTCLKFCSPEAEPEAGFLFKWFVGVAFSGEGEWEEWNGAGEMFSKDVISFRLIPSGALKYN